MHASEPLNRAQKTGICLLLLLCIAFGVWVEFRGSGMADRVRRTDLGVYLRAAWAVRSGDNIYKIPDNRGWHYVYPPVFAVSMAPLADPPRGVSRYGYLPYELSVGIWYVLTLAIGFYGVHSLAKALEETSGDPAIREQPVFCRRWWALRILPVLVLLPAIGRAQMRGQVDMLLVFTLCATAASILHRRRLRAGMWLSVAACIKIIPAFLLLLPAWRRDWRMLSGSLIGLVFGLIIIPVIAMGPNRVLDGYNELYNETLLGGITGKSVGRVAGELTGITSTDSNAPMVIMHNAMYPDVKTRPNVAAPGVRITHWGIAVLLTIITLYAAGWKTSARWFAGKVDETPREILFLGSLLLTMLIISPVFSPHYVSIALPLITVLLSMIWDRYPYPNIPFGWKALFWLLVLSHLLTAIGGVLWFLRDFGLVLLTTLLLWAGSVIMLRNATEDIHFPIMQKK